LFALSFFATIAALILSASATSLCFFYFDTYRHRAASWMASSLAGLTCFIVALLCVQVGVAAGGGEIAGIMRTSRLVLTSLGAVVIVHAVPRFLLAAFGTEGGRRVRLLLGATSLAILALSVVRCVTGWSDEAAIPPAVNNAARIYLYAFIVIAFASVLLFQARLPDRNLFKTVLAQLGTLLFLTPIVILEDLEVIVVPAFPNFAGLALGIAFSIFAMLHARRSFNRPKYVEAGSPSAYFVERFGLSEREREVVAALLSGLGNAEIADKLFISVRTVENHLHRVYQKTGIKNRLQLHNLLSSDSM
jgi:DNA-binding CsgD family transcriptional regulator